MISVEKLSLQKQALIGCNAGAVKLSSLYHTTAIYKISRNTTTKQHFSTNYKETMKKPVKYAHIQTM
jgi:hypothetical protein